jgi:ubiquitin carboxyl-terminal hydrolase L5
MDILNSDLQLQVESKTRKKSSQSQGDDDSDSSFHFIAFMPVMGQVWKFDGLERQPQLIGEDP